MAAAPTKTPPADLHDTIRVQGSRVNNLKDVSVEIPKRRLTVFTGVSGSGKSSLVFGTIAAESQRMINETYSTFVQGFMPSLARPDVDLLEGLTTAIIVDQERMGANIRSTVGTVTDVNAMLRILFSRLGEPHIGTSKAFSFNVASISGAGAVTVTKGGMEVKERREFAVQGGMCARCEGVGKVSDFDLGALYDDTLSLREGALTIPGYSMDGWYGRIYMGSGFVDPDKAIKDYTKRELAALLYKEPTKIKVDNINVTYEGLIPRIQKSMLSKDREAMQPHIRAFVDRAVSLAADRDRIRPCHKKSLLLGAVDCSAFVCWFRMSARRRRVSPPGRFSTHREAAGGRPPDMHRQRMPCLARVRIAVAFSGVSTKSGPV